MHKLEVRGEEEGEEGEGFSVDVFEALLERDSRDTPWGLELRGGSDAGGLGQPLRIGKVGHVHVHVTSSNRVNNSQIHATWPYLKPCKHD